MLPMMSIFPLTMPLFGDTISITGGVTSLLSYTMTVFAAVPIFPHMSAAVSTISVSPGSSGV